MTKQQSYDETIAQNYLSNNQIDDCIIYCLPLIKIYLSTHKWRFITPYNYEDIEQELAISLITSISSYNIGKNVKLMSWIYTNFRFACLAISKKENPYNDNNVQLFDAEALYYTMNEEDIDNNVQLFDDDDGVLDLYYTMNEEDIDSSEK